MAKYTITHKCGHIVEHNITGKVDQRDYKASKLTDQLCYDCYIADQKQKNQELTKGLPDLEGSEKQISWANDIRAQKIKEITELKKDFFGGMKDTDRDIANKIINDTMHNKSAKFWIEIRDQLMSVPNWMMAIYQKNIT